MDRKRYFVVQPWKTRQRITGLWKSYGMEGQICMYMYSFICSFIILICSPLSGVHYLEDTLLITGDTK